MSEAQHTTSSQGSIERLTRIVDDIEPVLNQETFLTRELPGEKHERKATVSRLKVCGAIESTEIKYLEKPNHGSYINVWRWVQHRERLIEYLEDRDELPCGCRSHIPAETDDEGRYPCKFCGAKHDKQTIKESIQ